MRSGKRLGKLWCLLFAAVVALTFIVGETANCRFDLSYANRGLRVERQFNPMSCSQKAQLNRALVPMIGSVRQDEVQAASEFEAALPAFAWSILTPFAVLWLFTGKSPWQAIQQIPAKPFF